MSISVIIPAYGHAQFLGEAVSSVLASTGDVVSQVVVVADGDSDCYDVARAIDDSRVTSLLLDGNHGSYIAQNTGMPECSGDWITFMGADDLVEPTRFEEMYNLANSIGSTAVTNSWHRKFTTGSAAGKLSMETLGGVFMYHSEMIKALGGFSPWPCTADTDMFWRSRRIGSRKADVQKPLYLYRQHGDQLTHRSDTRFGSAARSKYESMARGQRYIYIDPVTAPVCARSA